VSRLKIGPAGIDRAKPTTKGRGGHSGAAIGSHLRLRRHRAIMEAMRSHRTDPIRRLSLLAAAGASVLAGCGSLGSGNPRVPSTEHSQGRASPGTSPVGVKEAWGGPAHPSEGTPARGAQPDGLPEEIAREVVVRALSLVDTPYRRGGNTPSSGFDCSGLIAFVFRDAAGIHLPRTVAEMAALGRPIPRQAVRSADLVFFDASGPLSHAGIYVGDGKFAHAPTTGGRVRLDRIHASFWSPRLAQIRRV
jgi:cell wall-associated NlpC family hydrolase